MDDPVLLGFLEAQMAAWPEGITAADPARLERIGKPVKGVKTTWRRAVVEIDGWRLYYFRAFAAALDELEAEVAVLAAGDPRGYRLDLLHAVDLAQPVERDEKILRKLKHSAPAGSGLQIR